MTKLKNILLIARWLSIDVVFGGVILCEAVARVAGLALHWSVPAALACTIWLIYTLDHLIDGNRTDQTPSMPRHLFHRKYKNIIFMLFVLVAGFGLKLSFYLPVDILIHGCILLGLVGLYFLSIWMFRIYFAKELFIAVLYGCGVFLGVFSQSKSLDVSLYFLFAQLVLLAFINLLLFSYFEVDQDKADGHRSWATHFGRARTARHLSYSFVVLGFIIVAALFFVRSDLQLTLHLIFIVMSGILGVIYLKPDRFQNDEQFRWLGDMVFMIPILIFLL